MRIWAGTLALATTAWGCPLEVRETPGCRLDSVSCNDSNPCTNDSCDESNGQCVFEPVATGANCDDGNLCNGVATCSTAGVCETAEPIAVDDGDPCTRDSCDADTGTVTHEAIDGCGESFWTPLASDNAPSARVRHTAVWTGNEMIVWGGRPAPGEVTDTGARYDPETNSWAPVTTFGAPAPRHSHTAVWTGSEMIVWGGFGASGYETTGARYNPVNDTWTAISTSGAPGGRTFHSAVWTGTEMLVWGGINNTSPLSSGARYALGADTRTALPGSGSPSSRFKHAAVWTGSTMIVWSGSNTFDWLDDGAVYDRTGDSWVNATSQANVPFIRAGASAAWVGSHMLIWGGWDGGNYLGEGSQYDPMADTWMAISDAGPSGRAEHAWVWTGDKLVVWGGCNDQGCETPLGDGGHYDTDNDTWIQIGSDPGLSARIRATAIWTGTVVLIWGGENASATLGDGARATIE